MQGWLSAEPRARSHGRATSPGSSIAPAHQGHEGMRSVQFTSQSSFLWDTTWMEDEAPVATSPRPALALQAGQSFPPASWLWGTASLCTHTVDRI